MSKAGFAIERCPTREELVKSFWKKTPLQMSLKPFGETEGFEITKFTIALVIEGLKEPNRSSHIKNCLIFEGSRWKHEIDGVMFMPPFLIHDWRFAVGLIDFENHEGYTTLRTDKNGLRILRDILANDPIVIALPKGKH